MSLLAHAEVNALAGLSPERRYEKHVLLTALEPCLLCIGATRLATVGAIRYGAPDPYGGAAAIALADSNPMLERLGLDVSGPELDASPRCSPRFTPSSSCAATRPSTSRRPSGRATLH